MSKGRLNVTGERYGRLTALYLTAERSPSAWACQCDCGVIRTVRLCNLRSGNTRSCGCLDREMAAARLRKHGRTGTREWRSFQGAKHRCTNPRSHKWRHYGGRGIEFRFGSFDAFLAHIGPRPEGTSLDRIDVDGHYEPGNVRWATDLEQQRNRRSKR